MNRESQITRLYTTKKNASVYELSIVESQISRQRFKERSLVRKWLKVCVLVPKLKTVGYL